MFFGCKKLNRNWNMNGQQINCMFGSVVILIKNEKYVNFVTTKTTEPKPKWYNEKLNK